MLVGAERTATLVARGLETAAPPLSAPRLGGARHGGCARWTAAQWPRFTDFGVTLFDARRPPARASRPSTTPSAGCTSICRRGGRAARAGAEVALFPGFADPRADQRWTATVSVRLYADSAHVVPAAGAGRDGRRRAERRAVPLPMPDPRSRSVTASFRWESWWCPDGDRTWTREVPLPAAGDAAQSMTDRIVRVAAGQGFWGDWLEAPVRQVQGGPIDYLMMDYLAEVTMSIMQKQKSRDPRLRVRPGLRAAHGAASSPISSRRGIKVTSNAGGVNPRACAEAVREAARKLGLARQGPDRAGERRRHPAAPRRAARARATSSATSTPAAPSPTSATRCSRPTPTSAWRRSSRRCGRGRRSSSPAG